MSKTIVVTGASRGIDVLVHNAGHMVLGEVVSAVADRIRVDFFHRVGIGDLLTPGSSL